jgi:hypothetical protein
MATGTYRYITQNTGEFCLGIAVTVQVTNIYFEISTNLARLL